MTKKTKKSKTTEVTPSSAEPVVDDKSGFDLDDLFAASKIKKQQPQQPSTDSAKTIVERTRPSTKPSKDKPATRTGGGDGNDNNDDDALFTDLRGSKKRKTTAEGYKVYKDDELRLFDADAGLTDLCPFDCECCY